MKEKRICRWLSPAHQVGQSFCSYILIDNTHYLARSTVIRIPDSDLTSDAVWTQMDKFTAAIESESGNYRQGTLLEESTPDSIYHFAFNDLPMKTMIKLFLLRRNLLMRHFMSRMNPIFEELDKYIGCHVVIPGSDGVNGVLAQVKRRKRDSAGNLIGTANQKPILDSQV